MSNPVKSPLIARQSDGLRGVVRVPGDKSISHRSLMLGAVSVGQTEITGLLESADIHATARAMASFGARVERHQDGRWTVGGLGTGGSRRRPSGGSLIVVFDFDTVGECDTSDKLRQLISSVQFSP